MHEGHAKIAPPLTRPLNTRPLNNRPRPMDIERINQIGNLLADLTARTVLLRGYL